MTLEEQQAIVDEANRQGVAVSGNPANDVTDLDRVKFVMKGGQVFRNDFAGSGANVSQR